MSRRRPSRGWSKSGSPKWCPSCRGAYIVLLQSVKPVSNNANRRERHVQSGDVATRRVRRISNPGSGWRKRVVGWGAQRECGAASGGGRFCASARWSPRGRVVDMCRRSRRWCRPSGDPKSRFSCLPTRRESAHRARGCNLLPVATACKTSPNRLPRYRRRSTMYRPFKASAMSQGAQRVAEELKARLPVGAWRIMAVYRVAGQLPCIR